MVATTSASLSGPTTAQQPVTLLSSQVCHPRFLTSPRRPQPRVLPLLWLQSPASRGLLPEVARQNSV